MAKKKKEVEKVVKQKPAKTKPIQKKPSQKPVKQKTNLNLKLDNLNKKRTKKRILFIVLLIVLILAIASYFIFFNGKDTTTTTSSSGGGGSGGSGGSSVPRERVLITEVTPGIISQMMSTLGAKELHNPPLSKDTPKIKIYVDDDVYVAEVIDNKIKITQEEMEKVDLIIYTKEQEILDAVNSNDFKGRIGNSFNTGQSTFEIKASYVKLFSKGYAGLYEKLTGKDIQDLISELS